MLSKHLSGLLGSRYFPNPVGEVPLVVYELEDGVFVVGFPRFFASQDREPVFVGGFQPFRCPINLQVSEKTLEAVIEFPGSLLLGSPVDQRADFISVIGLKLNQLGKAPLRWLGPLRMISPDLMAPARSRSPTHTLAVTTASVYTENPHSQ